MIQPPDNNNILLVPTKIHTYITLIYMQCLFMDMLNIILVCVCDALCNCLYSLFFLMSLMLLTLFTIVTALFLLLLHNFVYVLLECYSLIYIYFLACIFVY